MRAKLNWLGVVLAAALLAGVGDQPGFAETDKADKAAGGDVKRMQGTWTAAAAGEAGGEQVVYTFKDNKLTVKGNTRTYEMTVTIDESAKPEKTIDMKIDKAPEDAKGQTSKGIYKFDGNDKLVLCFRPAGDRPQKFEQVEVEQFLVTLARKADK